ncbi:fatty acid--CoA ligase family protein [Pseudomonas piscis]|uniref:Fatty acid--CoA ligase family protein n=1 Tax=Pseudomonas piscis TaxID=2614538 RepID=A0ABY9N8V3_9PSED|nr:fatty acid--CoA ligase family protein [Pseudomonas piscis]WMN14865.1 fatty acid--CoA ligase family protein [Pseudomonas piscis]
MINAGWLRGLEARGVRRALVDGEVALSYMQVAQKVRDLATHFIQFGIAPGHVVVLHGNYSANGVLALLALAAIKAIVAPVTNLTPSVEETLKVSCDASFMIRAFEDVVVEPCSGQSRHLLYSSLKARGAAGLILLSSGSTGRPKAILHDLDKLIAEKDKESRGRQLVVILFLMFDHIGGVNTLINILFSGNCAVVVRERTPDAVCRELELQQVQVLPANPTFLNLLRLGDFHQRYDLSALRLITYGTEAMPAQLLVYLRKIFPRVRLLQTFGTSETGIAGTQSASSQSTRFKIVDESFEHRIVDGELQLKSPSQFLGYLNVENTSLTEDGWFRTGDLAESGSDGEIQILGRMNEVINVGGEKVLPIEVESLLLACPLVQDCLVYGISNAITGQAVGVNVKPAYPISAEGLRKATMDFLAGKLERFKMPVRVRMVDEIAVSERAKKKRNVER